ncbi:hypothetical protein, partial [Burkholderia ubonensis]|uniref:hypothetical protein n=1 Tax=Burkholderia ubonensis TaxID=101571 RepID=UPI001C4363CB
RAAAAAVTATATTAASSTMKMILPIRFSLFLLLVWFATRAPAVERPVVAGLHAGSRSPV